MSYISQMSFQNPWWIDKSRIFEDEHVKKAKVIIPPIRENALILGPRQVGKTTFLKTSIKTLLEEGVNPNSILFFSCDALSRKDELVSLINEYRTLVNKENAYIFLDEITSVSDWNIALLHLFNAGYFNDSLVYVTGSSSVNLKKEMLPGRPIKKFVFYPLNFRVYFNTFVKRLDVPRVDVTEKDKMYELALRLSPYISEFNKALMEYVKRGGFFATSFAENPLSLYEVYKDAILSEFLKSERKETLFKFLARKIIERYGSRISDNSIARELSISHTTVADYLDIMEKLFIIRIFRKGEEGSDLPVYRSMKKVYFIDPFIFRVMKIYSLGKDVESEEIPRVIEGIVGEHLAREYNDVTYLHYKSGKEVDFFTRGIKIEVKWEKRVKTKNKLDYLLTVDEFNKSEGQLTLPVSIFLYLISSDKFFYELS